MTIETACRILNVSSIRHESDLRRIGEDRLRRMTPQHSARVRVAASVLRRISDNKETH